MKMTAAKNKRYRSQPKILLTPHHGFYGVNARSIHAGLFGAIQGSPLPHPGFIGLDDWRGDGRANSRETGERFTGRAMPIFIRGRQGKRSVPDTADSIRPQLIQRRGEAPPMLSLVSVFTRILRSRQRCFLGDDYLALLIRPGSPANSAGVTGMTESRVCRSNLMSRNLGLALISSSVKGRESGFTGARSTQTQSPSLAVGSD